jgi:hypothetical protein
LHFSPKNLTKYWRFWSDYGDFLQKFDRYIDFWEKHRKLAKIGQNCDHNIDPWMRQKSYDFIYSNPGLPDFSWYNIPEPEKLYQIFMNLFNVHITYQMTIHKIYVCTDMFHLRPSERYQSGIFSMQIFHLVTLTLQSWIV